MDTPKKFIQLKLDFFSAFHPYKKPKLPKLLD